MAEHGVKINEVPTGVKPAVRTDAGLAVYTGTAPINMGDVTKVNKPVLISTLAEAVEQLGYIDAASAPWSKWTLLEAIKAHFSVYSVGPIVCINVIDPDDADHVNSVAGETHVLDADGKTTLQIYGDDPTFGVLLDSVVVERLPYTVTRDVDYTLEFDDDGYVVVTRIEGGDLVPGDEISVDYDYLDPDGVTSADIIGGYSAGVYKGLEVIKQVYPKLRRVPGFLLAPKWSQEPAVAARLGAIAPSINGAFRAMALVDLSTDPAEIATYADAPAWKSDNGFDVIDMAAAWPKFKNGDDVYHLSTVIACVANLTDYGNRGVPFESPGNKNITGTSAVLDDGTEVYLEKPQANALNAQGIVTALNGFFGWVLWGNRGAGYPGTTDPKDAFIAIRRMFNYVGNTIILTTDRDVDAPGNRRLIDGVVGTITAFINGLIALGALVDGKIEFRADENPTTDLSDGIIRFHVTLTPPSPAESIEFTLEYDPSALAALFA